MPGSRIFDLVLFTGQSNMAGRGISDEKHPETYPALIEGAGFEFRAVSDPDGLHPIEEPFGVDENRLDGIDDYKDGVSAKTGSLVTCFANTYFQLTGVPVLGISASKGMSSIHEWTPGKVYYLDMMDRIGKARAYAEKHGMKIRHSYVLFCQGERDSRLGTSSDEYERLFLEFWSSLKKVGFEKCFIVTIGRFNHEGAETLFDRIRELQYRIASEHDDIEIVSDSLKDMQAKGLMKDELHYYQKAYNIVGVEAAVNLVKYVN